MAVENKGNFNDIEEYELNPTIRQNPTGLKKFRVDLWANGYLKFCECHGPLIDEPIKPLEFKFHEDTLSRRNQFSCMFLLYAKNKEHAIKLAGENRQELQRYGLWLDTYEKTVEAYLKFKLIEEQED